MIRLCAKDERILRQTTLTFTGVPSNSGLRMGISRLLNGVLDGDQPAPAFRIQATGENTLISWSATADYVLEVSESLAAPRWETEVSVRETFDGEFKITRPADAQTRFFRLRRL